MGAKAEILPALTAMLVAVPAAIANATVMYAPLGPSATAAAAMAGIVGAVALGTVAPILGGTPRLVSAPSPAATAFMAVVATDLLRSGVPAARLPTIFALVVLVAGASQVVLGAVRGGRLVKFLPYPVVAGYLTGAGLLILHIQIPRLLGVPAGSTPLAALSAPSAWNGVSVSVASVTVAVALVAPRFTARIPATLMGIVAGALTFRAFAALDPGLLRLDANPLLVGALPGSGHLSALGAGVARLLEAGGADLERAAVPGVTLAVLVSIDTLKTCLLVDVTTHGRHDSDRELLGQGLGNVASAFAGGAPGTGIVSATMVNIASGARGRLSGVLAGIFALGALLLFGGLISYLPVPALTGVVCLMAVRMFQREALQLVRARRTALDFAVVVVVVVTAMAGGLVAAAGIGVVLSAGLYLREQVGAKVVRRTALGDAAFSKRRRSPLHRAALLERGSETAVVELQGSLFFGTADRLQRELEPFLRSRTLVVDLGRARSVDVTAANALRLVATRLADHGGRLALCDLPTGAAGQRLAAYLDQFGLLGALGVRVFPHLDDALEWAEDELLARAIPDVPSPAAPLELHEIELVSGLPPPAREALRPHLREHRAEPGERLFAHGGEDDDLYLIREGRVRLSVPLAGGRVHRLATLGPGEFFGEIAFMDGRTRTAEAVAERATHVYTLSRRALTEATAAVPTLEQQLHARLAGTLAERLRDLDVEVHALKEL